LSYTKSNQIKSINIISVIEVCYLTKLKDALTELVKYSSERYADFMRENSK